MAKININFVWPRGTKYRVVEVPEGNVGTETYIEQVGSDQIEMQPLVSGDAYLEFAKLHKAKDFTNACWRFAYAFGLPTQRAEDGARERLSRWRVLVEVMHQSVEGLRRAKEENALPPLGAAITDIDVMLIPGSDGVPALSLRPHALWEAMRLQMAQSIADGRDIATCPNCSKWFEVGGRRGTGGKRADSTFCSDPCKNQFKYRTKKGAAA
jgi:hypothetical protein